MSNHENKEYIDLKVEVLYNIQKKSTLVAYLLGAVLGGLGVHYFYAKRADLGAIILGLLLAALSFGLAFTLIYYAAILFGVIHTYFVVQDTNRKIKKGLEFMLNANMMWVRGINLLRFTS